MLKRFHNHRSLMRALIYAVDPHYFKRGVSENPIKYYLRNLENPEVRKSVFNLRPLFQQRLEATKVMLVEIFEEMTKNTEIIPEEQYKTYLLNGGSLEELLVEAVKIGHVNMVEALIERHPDLDLFCVDYDTQKDLLSLIPPTLSRSHLFSILISAQSKVLMQLYPSIALFMLATKFDKGSTIPDIFQDPMFHVFQLYFQTEIELRRKNILVVDHSRQ